MSRPEIEVEVVHVGNPLTPAEVAALAAMLRVGDR